MPNVVSFRKACAELLKFHTREIQYCFGRELHKTIGRGHENMLTIRQGASRVRRFSQIAYDETLDTVARAERIFYAMAIEYDAVFLDDLIGVVPPPLEELVLKVLEAAKGTNKRCEKFADVLAQIGDHEKVFHVVLEHERAPAGETEDDIRRALIEQSAIYYFLEERVRDDWMICSDEARSVSEAAQEIRDLFAALRHADDPCWRWDSEDGVSISFALSALAPDALMKFAFRHPDRKIPCLEIDFIRNLHLCLAHLCKFMPCELFDQRERVLRRMRAKTLLIHLLIYTVRHKGDVCVVVDAILYDDLRVVSELAGLNVHFYESDLFMR